MVASSHFLNLQATIRARLCSQELNGFLRHRVLYLLSLVAALTAVPGTVAIEAKREVAVRAGNLHLLATVLCLTLLVAISVWVLDGEVVTTFRVQTGNEAGGRTQMVEGERIVPSKQLLEK